MPGWGLKFITASATDVEALRRRPATEDALALSVVAMIAGSIEGEGEVAMEMVHRRLSSGTGGEANKEQRKQASNEQ